MPQFIIPIFIVIFGVIVFLSFYFSNKTVVKRKLKKANVIKISNFMSGETAKINGSVEIVDKPLIAPLSKRECAYYHVVVEENVSSGKSSHWETLIEEEDSCQFVIRDGRSCAYIDDENIKSYIVDDWKSSSGFMNDADDFLEEYLQAHGYKSENFLGLNKTIRYREGVLEQGERIAVLGKGEWKSASQCNLSENFSRILVISSPDEGNVYLSDAPETTNDPMDVN